MCEAVKFNNSILRDDRIVKGRVPLHKGLNECRSLWKEPALSYLRGSRWFFTKCPLRFYNGPDSGRDALRIARDQCIGGSEPCKGKVTDLGRVIATSHIEKNFSYPSLHRSLAPHGIGPEAIHLA